MSGVDWWGPTQYNQAFNAWDTCTLKPAKVPTTNTPPVSQTLFGTVTYVPDVPINGNKITLPGIVKVTVTKSIRTDVQTAPGRDNANIIYRGVNPANVTIQFTIWTFNQWQLMQQVLDALYITPNKLGKLSAYECNHPVILARKIGQLIITEITGPDDGEFTGGSKTVKLTCLEYGPPPFKPVVEPSEIEVSGNDIAAFSGTQARSTAGAAVAPSVGKKPKP